MSESNTNPQASFVTSLRTIRVYNAGDETIPGYAIMRFANLGESPGSDGDDFFRQDTNRGEVAWEVQKPDAKACATLEPSNFCFNLQTPIKPKGYGRATVDFPCQVLHNGKDDSLPNGFECGPVPDEWHVLSSDQGGVGFNCLSHDISQAAGSKTSGEHTVWIGLRRERTGGHGQYYGAGVDPGERVELFQGGSTSLQSGMEVIENIVRVDAPGLYLFGWQCCMTSDEDRGTLLRLDTTQWSKATRNSEGNVIENGTETPTIFYGFREQEVEEDQYGNEIRHGTENVACTGFANLDRDEGLSLKNVTSKRISLSGVQFWMILARPFIADKPSGGLHYP